LKKRFLIFVSANQYPYESQVKLVLALMAVQNFILQKNGKKEYREWEYQIEKERREREERL